MRIAVLSDIHGNRTAFEAVLADLREVSPDLILHGGDLAHGGSAPAEIVDCIRDLGRQGVVGNTDEMLVMPESLEEFASEMPHLQRLFSVIREMADVTREALGEERLAWLGALPRSQILTPMALVHACPESLWRAPALEAGDEELESVYGVLGQPVAVYAHIHRSYIRKLARVTIVNTGSVSLSYDGDPRAAYLLLNDFNPEIRRVEYDVNREIQALVGCGLPHADWIGKTLQNGRFQMP
ncbi:metallophosphoesterase family protein [Alloacidobacterium dinghuense]|uniref:Metallophosphoesterase family protein n=1 Tax=Alloacidobacterium dinghuense TaxID=2763107 RepID=A0A7G8BGW8_9BACT|nr:metallophosphoesterase family protein [Alloacidobacterium dinghuense]QNI31788.1 metallophosphoesterase family protein [Alloacidobacterium dinghuense]